MVHLVLVIHSYHIYDDTSTWIQSLSDLNQLRGREGLNPCTPVSPFIRINIVNISYPVLLQTSRWLFFCTPWNLQNLKDLDGSRCFLISLGLKDQVKDFLEKAAENNLIQCYVHICDFLGCITFMIPYGVKYQNALS